MTDDGLIQKDAVRRAVGSVLFNVSNFPKRARSKLWGANMGPLNEKITDAVLAALAEVHTPSAAGPCVRGDHETCQTVAGLRIGSCGCPCHTPEPQRRDR